jgi:hypothetical protein
MYAATPMCRKLLEHAELFAVANAPRIPLVARAINRLMMLVVTKTSIKVNARWMNALRFTAPRLARLLIAHLQ